MKRMIFVAGLALASMNAQANPVYKELHDIFSAGSALTDAISTKIEGSDPALSDKVRAVFNLLQTCEVKTSESAPENGLSGRETAELTGAACPLSHKETSTYEVVRNRDVRSKQAVDTVLISDELKNLTGLRGYEQRVNAYSRNALIEDGETMNTNVSLTMNYLPVTGAALKISATGKWLNEKGAESSELTARFRYKGTPFLVYLKDNADGSRVCKLNNADMDCAIMDYITGERDTMPGEEAPATEDGSTPANGNGFRGLARSLTH